MRTIILITALFCLLTNASAQQNFLFYHSKVKPTALPYHGSNSDEAYPSYFNHWFNYNAWPGHPLNTDTWIDMGLTVSQDEGEGLQGCSIFRTFIPTNGNYKLMAVSMSGLDAGKSMLITINNTGGYIDALEVAADMLLRVNGGTVEIIFVKQWSLLSDMKVVVYHLKPTSATPLSRNSGSITFPLQAQRIDRTYQISSTGQFSLLSTKLYQPKTYPLSCFTDKNYKIKDGNETPLP